MHQWLLLQILVLLMMDAESVRIMYSDLAVTNKQYCQSCTLPAFLRYMNKRYLLFDTSTSTCWEGVMRPGATYSNITSPCVNKKNYGQPAELVFRPRPQNDDFRLQPDPTEGLPEKHIFVRLVNNSLVSQRPASNNHQSFLCIKNSRHVSRQRPIINNRLSIRLTSL